MNEYNLSDMLRRIKALKKLNGINNSKLSEITGISLGTLSKILAGVTKEPSIESIIKIAHGLGTTADYLVFGEETRISESERALLSAYRAHPEMQPAINKMLDISSDGIQRAFTATLAEQVDNAVKISTHNVQA